MKILVTNDDGFLAKGLEALVETMRPFGQITVVAPKYHQSGMSMAVTMGHRPIAVRHIGKKPGEDWWYLDGTPASCVKFGIDNILWPAKPDIVISGINHGANAATAAIYSGTIGAAMEGAVNGIPGIGISLDSFDEDADFSCVEALLPGILEKLLPSSGRRFGGFYNINFPNLPAGDIIGVKPSHMGMAHWEREYRDYAEFLSESGHSPCVEDIGYVAGAEKGEHIYVMAGDFTSNDGNIASADHLLLEKGYVTVTPHTIDNTDYNEYQRLCGII